MKFSFIIPTKNEGKYLEGCLQSIRAQSVRGYEIIVVDTNSKDKTKAIARKYKAHVINEPRRGPGVARNTGAKASKGQILVFCDADVRFDRYFLEELGEKFKSSIGGCIFRLRAYDARKKFEVLAYDYVNCIVEFANRLGITFTAGSCFVYRRDVFFKAGGFREDMLTNEDHDLSHRAHKIRRFVFLSDITVETSARRVSKLGLRKTIKIYFKSTAIYMLNRSYLREYW